MRNSHLLAIAPTGNTSIYAGIVSGGLEPVFSWEYDRWVIQEQAPILQPDANSSLTFFHVNNNAIIHLLIEFGLKIYSPY